MHAASNVPGCPPIFSGGIAGDQVGGGLFRSRAVTISYQSSLGLKLGLRCHFTKDEPLLAARDAASPMK
jgi:hypothetical protein